MNLMSMAPSRVIFSQAASMFALPPYQKPRTSAFN